MCYPRRVVPLASVLLSLVLTCGPAVPAEWYVGIDGRADGEGSKDLPWDLESALAGRQKVEPGDTVWIRAGTYKHPDRKLGSPGYVVRLAGEEGKPIHVRAVPGERVTIDGGISVQTPGLCRTTCTASTCGSDIPHPTTRTAIYAKT